MGRKYTEAQNRATQKYIKEAYDTVTIRMSKGMREKYKDHAANRGTSLNKLVLDLLDRDMKEEDA